MWTHNKERGKEKRKAIYGQNIIEPTYWISFIRFDYRKWRFHMLLRGRAVGGDWLIFRGLSLQLFYARRTFFLPFAHRLAKCLIAWSGSRLVWISNDFGADSHITIKVIPSLINFHVISSSAFGGRSTSVATCCYYRFTRVCLSRGGGFEGEKLISYSYSIRRNKLSVMDGLAYILRSSLIVMPFSTVARSFRSEIIQSFPA